MQDSFSEEKVHLKCNEALSRDLWPLDPFESAPMRATSSAISYCILRAILELVKIKDLAELLDQKLGRNSLLLKIFPCGIFQNGIFASTIAKKIKKGSPFNWSALR
ncbi:MAG TPA: hypothetical protein VHA06_05145 [Candidatus Angelobacter sp.]|jgi:hypothetical protein|nr:hypothetical protein [Candidatus Angelobacter sp.]